MQTDINTLSTPGLRQSVRFGERYVSAALNRKLAGILGAGVYHGFVVKPGGVGRVLVGHEDDYPFSVAVVERNGFSLSIILDDPVYVEIPASGTWFIVIEAYYVETQIGYQRIVARENVEPHHVVLAKITCDDLSQEIKEDDIDTSVCVFSDTRKNADILGEVYALSVCQSDLYARLSDRVFKLELKRGGGESTMIGPEGYQLGDARIAPVTIIKNDATPPENAVFVWKVDNPDDSIINNASNE